MKAHARRAKPNGKRAKGPQLNPRLKSRIPRYVPTYSRAHPDPQTEPEE